MIIGILFFTPFIVATLSSYDLERIYYSQDDETIQMDRINLGGEIFSINIWNKTDITYHITTFSPHTFSTKISYKPLIYPYGDVIITFNFTKTNSINNSSVKYKERTVETNRSFIFLIFDKNDDIQQIHEETFSFAINTLSEKNFIKEKNQSRVSFVGNKKN